MKKFILTSLTVIFTLSIAFSQSFSYSGLNDGSYTPDNQNRSTNSTYLITHSLSQTIIGGNSASCNSGGLHTDNAYLRVFDLVTDFGINEDIIISSIDFGIELASSGSGGSQPAVVNVYTLSGTFIYANLTLIATQAISVADQTLSILNVPISATIPAGTILVIEVSTPSGQAVGNSFFIGSNNLGETDASYLATADCNIFEPTTTAGIGYPGMNTVMTVNADSAIQPIPLNNWAIYFGIFLIGLFVIYRFRRKIA